MVRFLALFFSKIEKLVHQPRRVLALSLGLVFISLIVNGSLFRIWSIQRDQNILNAKTKELRSENLVLSQKLKRAEDPDFVEREVIERLDMVNEGDLVFVFSDEE